jgi:hypothetical protein
MSAPPEWRLYPYQRAMLDLIMATEPLTLRLGRPTRLEEARERLRRAVIEGEIEVANSWPLSLPEKRHTEKRDRD